MSGMQVPKEELYQSSTGSGREMLKAVMSIFGFYSPLFSYAVVALGGGWESGPPGTPSDLPG